MVPEAILVLNQYPGVPKMTARFIISFDCEGKWGMADKISAYHQPYFTTSNLVDVYKKLLSLLDQYEMKATFAFVGAFTLSFEEYQSCCHELGDVLIDGKPWLDIFNREIKQSHEGWFAPHCYEMVKQAGRHEIGSHGFTHLPLDENSISLAAFQHEMNLLKQYARYKNEANLTFIYPRNQIGYTEHLAASGFIGYRNVLKTTRKGPTGKIFSLLDEMNIFARADQPSPGKTPIVIPPGRFLNWRSGLRKKIPPGITIKRWEHILRDAIKNDGILHLWSHPHNFITGDNMFVLFEEILKKLADAQKKEEIHNRTQREYCLENL